MLVSGVKVAPERATEQVQGHEDMAAACRVGRRWTDVSMPMVRGFTACRFRRGFMQSSFSLNIMHNDQHLPSRCREGVTLQ